MSLKQYFKQQSLKKEQKWTGITKRSAKGKSGNSGIMARNGQIEQVYLEAVFNRPGWIKKQYN